MALCIRWPENMQFKGYITVEKRSQAPTLTLTQTRCGLKVSLGGGGGQSFYGINLIIIQTELKDGLVVSTNSIFEKNVVHRYH